MNIIKNTFGILAILLMVAGAGFTAEPADQTETERCVKDLVGTDDLVGWALTADEHGSRYLIVAKTDELSVYQSRTPWACADYASSCTFMPAARTFVSGPVLIASRANLRTSNGRSTTIEAYDFDCNPTQPNVYPHELPVPNTEGGVR